MTPPPEVNAPPSQPEPPSAEEQEAAQQAAEDWLAYVDEGDIGQSYENAASLLKDQVTQEEWEQSIGEVQGQIGELQSRSFTTAQALPAPPEDPQGEYLAVQYAADYANLPVQESVVLTKDEDTWKVAGYLVRPSRTRAGRAARGAQSRSRHHRCHERHDRQPVGGRTSLQPREKAVAPSLAGGRHRFLFGSLAGTFA